MISYGSFLFFSMGLMMFLLGIILFYKKKVRAFNYLICSIVIVGFASMNQAVIASGLIMKYPHTFRIAAPFQFLYGPLYYLLIVHLVIPFRRFRWFDLCHLLPFIIHFIDYLPFFTLDAASKRILIEQGRIISIGNFPPWFYLIAKIISYLLYIAAAVSIWIRRYNFYVSSMFSRNRLIYRWLVIDLALRLVALSVLILNTVLLKSTSQMSLSNFLYNLDHFFNLMILLFVPSILKGLRSFNVVVSNEQMPSFIIRADQQNSSSHAFMSRQHNKLLGKLHQQLVDKKIFINQELSMQSMALLLQITTEELEALILQHWKFKFDECLAILRLQFIEQQITYNADWKDFTIDQITHLAGFRSRISFYAACEVYSELRNEHAEMESLDAIHGRFPSLMEHPRH